MYNIICKFRGVAMRLDISRVLTHDNYTLEFDCSEDFSARETADGSRPFAAVRVYGTVRMRYDGVRLQAVIEAPCTAPCSRCLEPVRFLLEEVLTAYVAESGEAPDDDGDKLVLPLKNGRYVELSEPVYDALLFAYPSKVLCSDDCKGLCPGCGCNLNTEQCSCVSGG